MTLRPSPFSQITVSLSLSLSFYIHTSWKHFQYSNSIERKILPNFQQWSTLKFKRYISLSLSLSISISMFMWLIWWCWCWCCADYREASADGGEGHGGQARRGDLGTGSPWPRRSGGAQRKEAPADEEDGREAEPLDLPRPRRVHRDLLREGLLLHRQGQRSRRLPLLPRKLALQGSFRHFPLSFFIPTSFSWIYLYCFRH